MVRDVFIKVAQNDDLRSCYDIRRAVFIDEQSVPEEIEMDALDAKALHFIAFDGREPVATARVIIKDEGKTAKIGRVAVLKTARGSGVGKYLMQTIEGDRLLENVDSFVLDAQTHAVSFYEKLGFSAYGEEFLDANIPHFHMKKTRSKK